MISKPDCPASSFGNISFSCLTGFQHLNWPGHLAVGTWFAQEHFPRARKAMQIRNMEYDIRHISVQVSGPGSASWWETLRLVAVDETAMRSVYIERGRILEKRRLLCQFSGQVSQATGIISLAHRCRQISSTIPRRLSCPLTI